LKVEPIAAYLGPLERIVTVQRPVTDAFAVFTRDFGKWWPLGKGFNVSGAGVVSCTFEGRAEGAIFETSADGERVPWGRVVAWEPPVRVAFTWHPGRDAAVAQEVEVRFEAEGAGTRVTLVHRDWQKLGVDAAKARDSYEKGWGTVLAQHFAPACL
jgi:uncharacterized protein YndB with AHSA1/START domain